MSEYDKQCFAQDQRMQSAFQEEFPHDEHSPVREQIKNHCKEYLRINGGIDYDVSSTKKYMRWYVKDRLNRRRYGFIEWQIIIWWILPTVIEWLVEWWLNDTYEQAELKRKEKFETQG